METIKNELLPVLKKIAKELAQKMQTWAQTTFTPENLAAANAFVQKNKKALLGIGAVVLLYAACSKSGGDIPSDVPEAVAEKVAQYPSTEKGARQLVETFARPGADFWEFTEMVKPARQDFQAYFTKDVADDLYEIYEEKIWNGRYAGQGLQRKPAQNYVKLIHGNTTKLKKGKYGGFQADLTQIADFIKDGFPYCEFSVVVQGKRKGTFYNNMVYVNGRWVIFPHLWGMLKATGHLKSK